MRGGSAGLAFALAGALAVSPLWGPARAGEVSDQIRQALQRYDEGRLGAAVRALAEASDRIRQEQAERLKQLLPAPLAGWTAEEPQVGSATAALLGGTVAASRRYTRQGTGGRTVVELEIADDTPLADALGDFSSQFVEPGVEAVEIKGRKGFLRTSRQQKSTDLSLALGGRALISARGQGVSGPEDMLAYVKALDWKAVEACVSP